MSATAFDIEQHRGRVDLPLWLPIAAGLALLFVPTYIDIAKGFWAFERGSQGPIILLIVAWLFWRQRGDLLNPPESARAPVWGWSLVTLGLLFYVLGRSQEFIQLEAGAQLPLLAGIVLLMCGTQALRKLWFPILFLGFLVPLPGSLLDAMLLPLKFLVSVVVEDILYRLDYPVARSGVVLMIGSFRLLIADACSGLNSMVALTGIGLLYVYIAGHASRVHNVLLLLSILPIAFIANILRVLILMLVTYYYGDAAGRAFHDQAGYLEIVFAFGGFFALDALLSLFFRRRPIKSQTA